MHHYNFCDPPLKSADNFPLHFPWSVTFHGAIFQRNFTKPCHPRIPLSSPACSSVFVLFCYIIIWNLAHKFCQRSVSFPEAKKPRLKKHDPWYYYYRHTVHYIICATTILLSKDSKKNWLWNSALLKYQLLLPGGRSLWNHSNSVSFKKLF